MAHASRWQIAGDGRVRAERQDRELVAALEVGGCREWENRDAGVGYRRRPVAAIHGASYCAEGRQAQFLRHDLAVAVDRPRATGATVGHGIPRADLERADEDAVELERTVRVRGPRDHGSAAEDARAGERQLGVGHRLTAAVEHRAGHAALPQVGHVGHDVLPA